METFATELAIIFGTAAILFSIWWVVRRVVGHTARGVADRTIAEVRRHDPPATVAAGANAWSCGTCFLASRFTSAVWIARNGRRVNAKSIMGVMMLAAGKGASIIIEADGDDAEAALAALQKLIADRFDEGE